MTAAVLAIVWLAGAFAYRHVAKRMANAGLVTFGDDIGSDMGRWIAYAMWPIMAVVVCCLCARSAWRFAVTYYEAWRLDSAYRTVARIRAKWGKS